MLGRGCAPAAAEWRGCYQFLLPVTPGGAESEAKLAGAEKGAASRMEKEAAPVRAATAPPSDECGCCRLPRANEEVMVDADVETTREVGRRRIRGGDGAMEDRVAVRCSCCALVIIDGKRVV